MARPKEHNAEKEGKVVIKKYANRRLYDTQRSSYVTLDDLSVMVKEDRDFIVVDAKTNEDITRSVLTQIIIEEENKGENLLPIDFLRQLISLYGENMNTVLPRYLEQSMNTFVENQEQIQSYFANAFSGLMPFGNIEELNKTNKNILEKTMDQTVDMMNAFAPTDMPETLNPVEQMKKMQKQMQKMQSDLAEMMTTSKK
mgnify:CR=1 FL=1